MIINNTKKYSSEYIKQHQYSRFYDQEIYLILPHFDLDPFGAVDDYIANKGINEYIPKEMLDRAYNKNLILALDLSAESVFRHIDIIYDNLIVKYNIPESQILIINPSKDMYYKMLEKAHSCNKSPCLFEYYFFYENMANKMQIRDLPKNYKNPLKSENFSKKYINFSGAWRYHRIALVASLKAKNLLEQGFNSFSKPVNYMSPHKEFGYNLELTKNLHKKTLGVIYHDRLKIASVYTHIEGNQWFNACPNDSLDDLWEIWTKETIEKFNDDDITQWINLGYDVYKKFPLKVDNTIYTRTKLHPYNTVVPEGSYVNLAHWFHKCYFSVVSETQFFKHQNLISTEKTYKPIIFKHPFLVLAKPCMLENLKDQGYKTFNPFIDESYDKELDDVKRFKMIVNEIERLCNLSDIELKRFTEGLLEIVDYNYDLLYQKQNFIKV